MEPIPAEIKNLYDAALNRHSTPTNEQHYYIKCLRYYLDFCDKYHHEKSSRGSLSLFIQKLKDKNQSDMQRKQAFHDVSIFYELKDPVKDPVNDKIDVLNIKEEDIPIKKVEPKTTNSDWRLVCAKLNEEIKLRHYSPKTLKTYRGWVRQFQNFTKSEDMIIALGILFLPPFPLRLTPHALRPEPCAFLATHILHPYPRHRAGLMKMPLLSFLQRPCSARQAAFPLISGYCQGS